MASVQGPLQSASKGVCVMQKEEERDAHHCHLRDATARAGEQAGQHGRCARLVQDVQQRLLGREQHHALAR